MKLLRTREIQTILLPHKLGTPQTRIVKQHFYILVALSYLYASKCDTTISFRLIYVTSEGKKKTRRICLISSVQSSNALKTIKPVNSKQSKVSIQK